MDEEEVPCLLTQEQLNQALADPAHPPEIRSGSIDAGTGLSSCGPRNAENATGSVCRRNEKRKEHAARHLSVAMPQARMPEWSERERALGQELAALLGRAGENPRHVLGRVGQQRSQCTAS